MTPEAVLPTPELDENRRHHALALAVETHAADNHPNAVLTTATRYLEWLRRPTPARVINLHVGEPIQK